MTKTYVITGATSGIGKALVESYKNEDVKLIIIARNLEKAQALKEVIDESKLEIVIADLENVASLKDSLKQLVGRDLDGLIYSAGVTGIESLRKTTYEKFLKVMNVNFFAFAEILRLCTLKKDPQKLFRCVAISSCSSRVGSPCDQIYCSSKAAMDAFIRASSIELESKNVEINSLQPNWVDTPLLDNIKAYHGDDFDNWMSQSAPLGMISCDEIVEYIRFMLDKKGNKNTGTSILINGGARIY